MAFDISSIALQDTAEMQLVHPVTGDVLFDGTEDKPVTFTLAGVSSQKYRKAVDAMLRSQNKRGKREASPDERRDESNTFLAALSIKVENMEYDGEPVSTLESFKALYADESLGWIKAQVNDFLGSTEAFLKPQKKI